MESQHRYLQLVSMWKNVLLNSNREMVMTITVNSLTKKAIRAYKQNRFNSIALNGIALTGKTVKLYILIQPEDTERNYLVCSWKYTNNMWKMDWDAKVSKEGNSYDN